MEKRLINRNLSFPTDDQSSEVLQPCKRRLNRPSSLITPQFATILIFLCLVIFPIRANQFNAPSGQSLTKRVAIISPVCHNTNRIFSGTTTPVSWHSDLLYCRLQQLHLTRRGRIEMSTERDSLAIDHHHPLRTFSAFGLSDTLAPFFAEAKLPSAQVSSQSSWLCSSSSDKNLRQILSQTPCSSHCCNRRQQGLADGYRFGRSFHRAPLRKTQIMPSKTSRLLRGLRPPLGDCVWTGNSGSNFFHCSSVINAFCFAIKNSFLQQSIYKSFNRASLKYL